MLAESGDLFVENNKVYYRGQQGPEQVGAIYRRISDEYLDPTTFLPESLIGIPGVMGAYRAGNVALLNAPGNGDGACRREQRPRRGTAVGAGRHHGVPRCV